MGRGRGRGRGKPQRLMRRDFQGEGRRENQWGDRRSHGGEFLDRKQLSNEAFEEYYKVQNVVPEGEWDSFVAALRKSLPITFRINGSGKFAMELREKMESDFFSNFSSGAIMIEGEAIQPPRPLPWYPNNLGWHMDFSRGHLRKLPWLADIHEWMKKANDAGSITRQEAVSMVPPLLLDVEPHHKVLDMCAAPGSKTFQLLEALHETQDTTTSSSSSVTPSGFVVANDADAQRCNLLTHQTKRMCSPCLIVTNHDGQMFPRITPLKKGSATAAIAEAAGLGMAVEADGGNGGAGKGREALLYDRILCDVPCSGDGTMRKAPDIWRRWSVNSGNGLHTMQLKIALQGIRLLKVGGRMVYSTCTFNPIEDEAVVAELLVRCKGAVQLVDVSHRLPELKRLQGLKTWKVRDKHQWYSSWEEAEPVCFKLDPTMFPDAEKAALPLERAMRILPHHQDTGGFFVAVLEKVAEVGPLPEPSMVHRFSRVVPSHRDAAVALDGINPLEGAKKAAEYAVQAAESAVAALQAGDAAAAEAELAKARAAVDKVRLAQDAARDSQVQQQRVERGGGQVKKGNQREEARAEEEEARAAVAAAGAGEDGGEGVAAMEEDVAAGGGGGGEEDMALDGDKGEEEVAAAAAGGEEEQAVRDAAAAYAGKQPWKPTWMRGGGGRNRAGGGGRFRGIDPIIPIQDPEIIKMLLDFYGVEPGFPLATHLITRSVETVWPKRLYFVSDALLALLLADEGEWLKITSTGLKVFERHEVKEKQPEACFYRIAQEGLPFLLPHLTKQLIRLGVDDFLRILIEKNLPIRVQAAAAAVDAAAGSAAADAAAGAAADAAAAGAAADAAAGAAAGAAADTAAAAGTSSAAAAADTASNGSAQAEESVEQQQKQAKRPKLDSEYLNTRAVVEQLASVQPGGAVCVLDESDARRLGFATMGEVSGALTANAPLAISVWRTRASLSVLVSKAECEQMVEKIRSAQQRVELGEDLGKAKARVEKGSSKAAVGDGGGGVPQNGDRAGSAVAGAEEGAELVA